MELLAKINALKTVVTLTKQERIVTGVMECITDEALKYGDILPSVNELSNKLGYSRETVVKSYKTLKERGLIKSKHGLGFFVSNCDVDQKLNIALVLYGFQTFQQDFYNKFRKVLGDAYKIDVFFHHNNIQMYESILNTIKLKYGMYVVAPIQSTQAEKLLNHFPQDKLLIVDRYQYLSHEVSHITQEFELSLSIVLEELEESIKQFEKIVLFYRDDQDYPIGINKSITTFCQSRAIPLEVHQEYEEKTLQQKVLYFTVGDTDLWQLLKDSKDKQWEIGKDIGIVAHNDSPVKEIIEGGITTFSTDFKRMASKAAEYVIKRKKIKEIMPCLLIRRKSF